MTTATTPHVGPSFSLFFFSASEESLEARKYRLVLDAARFADEHGFEALWVPERHFATLGGLYPNPAVLHAALAVTTRRLHLRAGSIVLPLHDPLRLAEEWSVVDNLSAGRVGVSLASGWNPQDFVLAPERFATRHDELFRALPLVQALWRGEPTRRVDGAGRTVDVRILPRPVQRELPVWMTAARSPETFERAGRCGANLLSHLLDQDVDELAAKLRLYREARAAAGFDPVAGRVTIMLHTFVGNDAEATREAARAPYCAFLRSNAELLKGLARGRGEEVDIEALSPAEQDAFINFLYDRFVGSRALIGTPATCLDLVSRLYAAGVDELACLLDFGPAYDEVLEHLPQLDELRRLAAERASADGWSRASAVTNAPAQAVARAFESPHDIAARCDVQLEPAQLAGQLRQAGFDVDVSAFERVVCGTDEALLELRPEAARDDDACFETGWVAALTAAGFETPLVPLGLQAFEAVGEAGPVAWCHARVRASGDTRVADVHLLAADGAPRTRLRGLQLVALPKSAATTQAVAEGGARDWYYDLAWEPQDVPASGGDELPRAWLVLCDEGGVGAALARALEQNGRSVTCLARGDVFGDARGTRLDEAAARHLRRAVEEAPRDGDARLGCVHLWGLDVPALEAQPRAALDAGEAWGVGAALVVLQACVASGVSARLWLATRGAQPVVPSDTLAGLAQATAWGFGRTCAMEHPELWGGVIDLDPADDAEGAARRLHGVLGAAGEDQWAFRAGQAYAARLQRVSEPLPAPLAVRSDATYVVTGGLWGLGLEVAHWLVSRGARHLALPGRTRLPARAEWDALAPQSDVGRRVAAVKALEQAGARVHADAVDVADEDALRAWLAALTAAGAPPVRGVVHAASVWRDAAGQSLIRTLAQLDLDALHQVFRPKVAGSLALHRVFAGDELDFLLFFSSAASLTGSAGQGNYAAASTFMDALAHHRRRLGRHATSANWGPVSGAGFGATEEGLKVHRYWESNGLGRLSPAELLAALDRVAGDGRAQVGVMKVDWPRLADFFPALRQARWASPLVAAAGAVARSEFREHLEAARALERRGLLLSHVQEQVAAVMRLERSPDPRRRLFDMGMDSLMALELKTRLQTSLGADVPVTAVFNYPTIEALSEFFLRDVLKLDDGAAAAADGAPSALDRLHAMSDEDAERLLAARLAGTEVTS